MRRSLVRRRLQLWSSTHQRLLSPSWVVVSDNLDKETVRLQSEETGEYSDLSRHEFGRLIETQTLRVWVPTRAQ